VHQDVRVDNIILTPCGRWMLIDYGLARVLSSAEPQEDSLKKKDFEDLHDVLLWIAGCTRSTVPALLDEVSKEWLQAS